MPSWRPGTGHAFFDERALLRVAALRAAGHGRGHRDDRRCDAPGDRRRLPRPQLGQRALPGLVHDWYWGRARIGDYTVIASFITATDRYGGAALPVFMLARGGAIVADDAARVRFSADEVFTDPSRESRWRAARLRRTRTVRSGTGSRSGKAARRLSPNWARSWSPAPRLPSSTVSARPQRSWRSLK